MQAPTKAIPVQMPRRIRIIKPQGEPVGISIYKNAEDIVNNTNQNARTWFDIAANFHSDQIHVVERFTPMDENRIAYEATIEDPKVYTQPWKIAFNITRDMTPGYRNMEFSCWEGEHDVTEKYTLESQGVDTKKLPKK
jgi:hypothetical protein